MQIEEMYTQWISKICCSHFRPNFKIWKIDFSSLSKWQNLKSKDKLQTKKKISITNKQWLVPKEHVF